MQGEEDKRNVAFECKKAVTTNLGKIVGKMKIASRTLCLKESNRHVEQTTHMAENTNVKDWQW